MPVLRPLIMILLTTTLAVADTIPLTLDWSGVKLDQPYPVTGGVPFARGALKDSGHVRLLIDGKDTPLQTEALAYWPDKSIKWLLLDFQTTPSQSTAQLEFGPDVKPAPIPKPILATQQGDRISIDTGLLRFAVSPAGNGFIDELFYRNANLWTAAGKRLHFMDGLHTASPADYPPMQRDPRNAQLDPSRIAINKITLEKSGPLHAVVLIDGVYKYQTVGSTITGTDVKGDCPFRLRIHAYAGQSFLRLEHFFYYEGDGDHDFVKSLAIKVPLPADARSVRYLSPEARLSPNAPLSGLYQQSPDAYEMWTSDGQSISTAARGQRFGGLLDVASPTVGVAVGIRDFWQNAAKSLHADLNAREAALNFWPPEAPPLDFRRHAREWSCGETGSPNDPDKDTPFPFERGNYRLASKGVGKTHYAFIHFHDPATPPQDLLAQFSLFNHRPLLWAVPRHYAASKVLGDYRERVPGEHEQIEQALDAPVKFWQFSQERFGWYGFWTYGNVGQVFNQFIPNGRWPMDFGRWGWANGDSVGRLGQALMLQAVRKCQRPDLEFAEKYLYAVHDVCSTHTPAYPHHYSDNFAYLKGAAHRHGAWPWACTYVGIRGAHPVGAKVYYFLTGEGHAKDILDEVTELVLKNPNGGEGDGPLGINAQVFLYQWEATGDPAWAQKLKAEIDNAKLDTLTGGWSVMMSAAFGIYNALEEYMALSGDTSLKPVAAKFADEAMPAKMKRHWTWGGYYRVYAAAYNLTGDEKYRAAIQEMLPLFLTNTNESVAVKIPEKDWPGPAGGPPVFVDANIIRDIPYALYSLHAGQKEEK